MAVHNTEEWRILLEEFKSKPELWQITSDSYKNKYLKNKAWKELLEVYVKIDEKGTIEALKRKIGNIRTCYRRELKKVISSERSGAGAEDVYVPTLWYFDLLNFLRDLEIPVSSISTVDILDEDEDHNVSVSL